MNSTAAPIVSVVIPTFNRRRLLCEAIDSVLYQNFPSVEIIVVDDGSTDATAETLAARYGDAVRCLRQENRGFGSARNKGVSAATGSYIAFLDSDDIWMKGKLALQEAVMERFPELAYTFTDFVIFDDQGRYDHHGLQSWFAEPNLWASVLPQQLRLSKDELAIHERESGVVIYAGDLYRPLLSHCFVLPSTAMVRAACLDPQIRHTEGDPHCADWDFFALLSRNHKAGFIDEETTLNRSHEDSVRLTRSMDDAEKAGRRLSSLARIWKADEVFVRQYGGEIARVESELLLQQAKCAYLAGRIGQTRQALFNYRKCSVRAHKTMALVLFLLTMIPFSSVPVRALLSLKG